MTYQKIMVPVDLSHLKTLEPALKVAADLAKHYQGELCYVGVTPTAPGKVAKSPEEFAEKLEAFAQQQASQHGLKTSTQVMTSSDPSAEMDKKLVEAVDVTGADLVVMATHLPRKLDILMPSNGGKVATHIDKSIFLVRV